jgi:hypothetical protein
MIYNLESPRLLFSEQEYNKDFLYLEYFYKPFRMSIQLVHFGNI